MKAFKQLFRGVVIEIFYRPTKSFTESSVSCIVNFFFFKLIEISENGDQL